MSIIIGGTTVKTLASKFLVVMEIMMKNLLRVTFCDTLYRVFMFVVKIA